MEPQTYASKSTAIRGAKRNGIKNPSIEKTDKGRWIVKDLYKKASEVIQKEVSDEVRAQAVQAQPLPVLVNGFDLNKPESIVPRRAGGTKTYSDLEAESPARSIIAAPVAFVWAFLDLNPNMGRKEAISILTQHGCNINTAKTQFQLWRTSKRE